LAQLHDIIQVAMGWYNSHLHMFRIYNESYSIPYDEDHLVELDAHDSRRVKLSKLIAAWIDGEFDPEAFDLDTINRALGRLK
jgi:hypothetical protein